MDVCREIAAQPALPTLRIAQESVNEWEVHWLAASSGCSAAGCVLPCCGLAGPEMSHALIPVGKINSASQYALAYEWDRLASGRRFPPPNEFNVNPDFLDPRRLNLWNVERKGRRIKFRAAYQGEAVAKAFKASWLGKTMDEAIPISLRHFALEAAKECVTGRCAVYMVLSTIDSRWRRVDCERLLLPFGTGSKVEQILASVQLTQVPGGINLSKIVRHFEIGAELVLAGRIESGFGLARAELAKGAAPRERRRATRRKVNKAGNIRFGRYRRTCKVANVSSTGALIESVDLPDAPNLLFLRLELEAKEKRCKVVWRERSRLGIQFI